MQNQGRCNGRDTPRKGRQELLEDTPMRKYHGNVPRLPCICNAGSGETLQLLRQQNELLTGLAGAVNALLVLQVGRKQEC